MADVGPVVGLSMPNVLAELERFRLPPPADIDGCAGWLGAEDFVELDRLLGRAFALARALPNQLLESWRKRMQSVSATERDALVRQRLGQDLFREGLMALWAGRCAITGVDEPALLRASHAKPWKDANDAERLDVYNGLLLTAHLDAAFDQGLIAVEADGQVVASSRLSPTVLTVLGLAGQTPRVTLRPAHLPYLAWHRAHVYEK
jgi:predicted restriction endonuclease